MKIAHVMSAVFIVLFSAVLGQSELPQQAKSETKGSCSPIIGENKGSITIKCTGFSEKQNKQIIGILRQLSLDQSKDQDALLSKMDEVIATVRASQRQNSPRIIPDEMQQWVLHSAWGTCAPGPVQIIAPTGDAESGNLAVQLRKLLEQTPLDVRTIQYANFKKEAGSTADFKIVVNAINQCGMNFLEINLSPRFSFLWEQPWRETNTQKASPELAKKEWDPTVPVLIYVYPK